MHVATNHGLRSPSIISFKIDQKMEYGKASQQCDYIPWVGPAYRLNPCLLQHDGRPLLNFMLGCLCRYVREMNATSKKIHAGMN
jgi:hypothetical protein